MKSIIHQAMTHPDVLARPPVLVDIGASGGLPRQWKLLAPYSIGIVFDADSRDFSVSESVSAEWKKLYSFNRLVATSDSAEVDFYLTQSPHCSSALKPDGDALKPWAFCRLFDVEKIVRLPAMTLQSALTMIGVDYIDWYKTDTQGTDLRIFAALPTKTVENIVAVEFEPGIIDAYVGEDKLHHVLAYMDKLPFWVTQMEIKGSCRIAQDDLGSLNLVQQRGIGSFLKVAPGWCEISYINSFSSGYASCREYLLGWSIATIKGEHGFALQLAKRARAETSLALFDEMAKFSRRSLSKGYVGFAVRAARKIGRIIRGADK